MSKTSIENAPLGMRHTRLRIATLALTLCLLPGISRGDKPPVIPKAKGSCSDCENDSGGTGSGGTAPPAIHSLDWKIKAGLGRFQKPGTLTELAQVVSEKNGNLPTFSELFGRFYPSSPFPQQLFLEIRDPQLSAATFHPSCLFMQAEAMVEKLTKPAAGGFPEYIHQLVTDDTFVLIDTLPSPDGGWRLRVWKRDAATLTKSGGYYVTTGTDGFEAKSPLTEVIFKRPSGVTANNTLIYIQKETTGLSGTRSVTSEIVQTLDGSGKPSTVTTKLFSGEGTSGSLLSQEDVSYSNRNSQQWKYTITRETRTASVAANGDIGELVLTARSQEIYDDISPPDNVQSGPGQYTETDPSGGKRLISRTEAFGVPGQTPQTTTYQYVPNMENPAAYGRLLQVVRPDGSWTFYDYSIFTDSPNSTTTEYSGWKDLAVSQRANGRRKITSINEGSSTVVEYVGSQLVGKSMTVVGTSASETTSSTSRWDGSAWHTTTTAYYLDSAAAPSTGRIKWIEKSDGTAETYTYNVVGGNLVMTLRKGAGSRTGVTAGTEVVTTYGLGNIAIAETTKDIASGLVTEQWVTDVTYTSNSGLDAMGRPVKRIYNADVNDYDISQYACCGLEYTRDPFASG